MKLNKKNIPFTMVANEVLCRKDISLKAKGLYAYLFSKPDDWDFSADRIAYECKEGRKGILTTLQELKASALLKTTKQPNGRIIYSIEYADSQSPQGGLRPKKPKSPVGTVPDGHGAERGLISNTDIINNKEKESNTDTPAAEPTGEVDVEKMEKRVNEINQLIDCFSDVNPSFANFFKNKTQRGSLSNLLKIHTKERLQTVIGLLKRTNRVATLPVITTPRQLEEKWASLEAGLIRHKEKLEEQRLKENRPKGKAVTI